MGLTVVDASVVIAVLDSKDAHHASATEALRAARMQRESIVVLPASAYAEVLVHPARAGGQAIAIVREFCTEQLAIEPLSSEIAEAAAQLRARYEGLRLPDALVVATAETLRADRLLTADRRWSAYSRRAEILQARRPG
jgi:predicted nucleic acid-binding protein